MNAADPGMELGVPLDHPSAPPADSIQLDCWSVTHAGDLRRLRRGLEAALIDQRVPADRALDAVPEKVGIVATELASNALRHGSPPVQVCLCRCDTAFIVDVTDTDIHHLPTGTSHRSPTFGLRITESLAASVGWYVDGHCKHVWAAFTLPHWQSATR